MDFINLTPHPVVLVLQDGQKVFQPSGTVARVDQKVIPVDTIDGIPIGQSVFGEVTGIPEPKEGTMYIVSSMVLGAATRDDLVAPDTSPTGVVRDPDGKIVGVKGFLKK